MSERRFRTPGDGPVTIQCRLCWHRVQVDPENAEDAGTYVYYRCPRCGGSFPIRREDVAAKETQG